MPRFSLRTCKRLACLAFLSSFARAQVPVQIHGYIQGRFTNQEGTPDRLEIRRARVIVSGKPLPRLSYTFQADLVKTPYIMDAAVSWQFSRALSLTGGQFKIPFSSESLISDNLSTAIARTRAVNSLSPGRDTGVQSRDTGLQMAGFFGRKKEPVLEYAAGVFSGRTLLFSPHLRYSAVAGRLLLHPRQEWTIGADWYASFAAPPKQRSAAWTPRLLWNVVRSACAQNRSGLVMAPFTGGAATFWVPGNFRNAGSHLPAQTG
jgi:hypothetical protein